MKDKIYFIVLKIPDLLFTCIQVLLIARFVAKLFQVPSSVVFVKLLYDITKILTFPIGVILSKFFVEGSLMYEVILVASAVIYAVLYLICLDILRAIFNKDDDEE